MSDRLMDKRVVKRNIARKIVSQEEYNKVLDSLEDCSELSTEVETQFIRKVQSESKEKE